MTAVELLAPGERTLNELAVDANREHQLVIEAGASMVEHAIRAGEHLLTAKEKCAAGAWIKWRTEHIDASNTTACLYMRVARFQDVVRESGIESLKAVRGYLAEVEPVHGNEGYSQLNAPAPHVVEAAIELRDTGMSWSAVGRELGVSHHAARRYVDPDYRRRCRDAERRRAARRHQATQALREREQEQAIKRAVKKAGGAMAELYSIAERAQDVQGQAHREATDSERRRHLSLAGEHYRKWRDEIVAALGVA